MQVRRCGGRRLHGVGQPEVKRELRRLGEGPDEEAAEDRRDPGAPRKLGRPRHCPAERVAAERSADEEDRRQQREPASRRHAQRYQRRPAGRRAVHVEPDQQEGENARELPEDEQDQQVVDEHGTEHARHEEQDQAEEAGPIRRRALRQVGAGVDHDQRADAGDEQTEEVREAVQAQRQLDVEGRRPGHPLRHCAPRRDRRREAQQGAEEPRGQEREHPTPAPAQAAAERPGRAAADERDREQHPDHRRV